MPYSELPLGENFRASLEMIHVVLIRNDYACRGAPGGIVLAWRCAYRILELSMPGAHARHTQVSVSSG